MTDSAKIKIIYSIVAVVSLLILGLSWFLTTLKKEQLSERESIIDQGKIELEELNTLSSFIELERQDGTPFSIEELNDKVWLAVQFYAECPMCAQRNASELLTLYREFQNNPNFRVVCLSVDPESDDQEKLQEVRDLLEVDPKNWFFVKAQREKLWQYMRNEMLFADIRERKEPAEIAAKGKWAHDLGIQLYRGNVLLAHWRDGSNLDVLRREITASLSSFNKE